MVTPPLPFNPLSAHREFARVSSLVELAFDVDASESDDAVMAFCIDAGAILTFSAGTAVNVAMLDILDA